MADRVLEKGEQLELQNEGYAVVTMNGAFATGRVFDEWWQADWHSQDHGGRVYRVRVVLEVLDVAESKRLG